MEANTDTGTDKAHHKEEKESQAKDLNTCVVEKQVVVGKVVESLHSLTREGACQKCLMHALHNISYMEMDDTQG